VNDFKIIINPYAEQDIREAKNWYDDKQDNLGSELLQEIQLTLNHVKANPFLFQTVKKNIRRAFLKRFPYALFYSVHKSTVTVFAVFHFSRNPGIWKEREA